ncbi:MaoC family protein [Micromonospora sp. C31]|uniref:MaoC/PaaZ C-terminal domain-containing protein n=1 Tax=Micromonospora sp. C31 TaxID=2824876 RepID=UPI001B35ED48|nr:MaoC/PaaZ C-terminal domain-containing protein [Micromonospora sp. C31]MBQ1075470.1 MaoC family protein [Micromonospora sp. C31]
MSAARHGHPLRALVGLRTSLHRAWSPTEAILYALGVGAGQHDPAAELRFTTENSTGHPQRVLPTFASVLAADPPPLGDLTVIRHAEEAVTLFRPLPPAGRVHTTAAVTALHDQGSGALVQQVSRLRDPAGTTVAVVRRAMFVIGAGGFGGRRARSAPWRAPAGPPGHRIVATVRPDQALLYRLSGDRNPLHSDPAVAGRAGLPRPILHGLCTFGFAGRLLLPLVGDDPARVRHVRARFNAPLHPGDTLTVHAWRRPYGVVFRVSEGTGRIVLDRGVLAVAAAR